MAADTSSNSTPSKTDSFIGSLISLTSKSEIRYEGILYSINTEESSIGLRNVRSFGTEGRKKDGPQVPPSDKVYEYILFRGTDIKDLQVKSSPPVQTATQSSSIDNDPAIIQSHYPRPASTSVNLPPPVTASSADESSHAPQLGHPGPNFQSTLPLYQPGGNFGSWGPSPPPDGSGGGLAMPMYWPGYYVPPNGLPHLPQQTLLRPLTGLSMPLSIQQPMQYPGFNPSLAAGASMLSSKPLEISPNMVTSGGSSTNFTLTSLPPSSLPPAPSSSLASETSSTPEGPKPISSPLLSTPSFPSISPLPIPASGTSALSDASSKVSIVSGSSVPNLSISERASDMVNAVSTPGLLNLSISHPATNKIKAVPVSSMPGLSIDQATSSIISSSGPTHTEMLTSSTPLLTPDQLQSGQNPISSSPSSEVAHKDVEVVKVSSSTSSEPKIQVTKEAQPPLLPLPPVSRPFRKPNGSPSHRQGYNYRGRERGRGGRGSRAETRFTEDFDFTAMNEKFNKDEVWGHLGKSNQSLNNGIDGSEEDVEEELPHVDVKPVYKKDDFFDTLSCNTLDNDPQNGRVRFSEQLKIDAETFGDFVRHRGGRGGRGPGRGGRGRGGYYGQGYGYTGRGRGRGMSPRTS